LWNRQEIWQLSTGCGDYAGLNHFRSAAVPGDFPSSPVDGGLLVPLLMGFAGAGASTSGGLDEGPAYL
jgi:hypothetical protein